MIFVAPVVILSLFKIGFSLFKFGFSLFKLGFSLFIFFSYCVVQEFGQRNVASPFCIIYVIFFLCLAIVSGGFWVWVWCLYQKIGQKKYTLKLVNFKAGNVKNKQYLEWLTTSFNLCFPKLFLSRSRKSVHEIKMCI